MGYLTFDVNVVFRRNSLADWTDENPVPRAGELVVESDTNRFKIGDGVTPYLSLGYAGVGGGDPGAEVPAHENSRIPEIVTELSYNLSLPDIGKTLVFIGSGDTTVVTVPPGEFPVGTILKGINNTHLDMVFNTGSGVVITPRSNDVVYTVHGELGEWQLYQIGEDHWFLTGDTGIPTT